MELATTWNNPNDTGQMLTVGDLMEKLKDEDPDTPLVYVTSSKLNYIHCASQMWVTGDGALRVLAFF